jgi:Ca2+-binding RTX toxin-like protein
MTLPSETVTLPGSGLTFFNIYSSTVTSAYRDAIIQAENFFQSHFTDTTTVGMSFDFSSGTGGALATNQYSFQTVSYATLTAALRSHATTADDIAAVNGLPASDPSGGLGFGVPWNEARILGLAPNGQGVDDFIVLNSLHPWVFGQDVVGVLEHEISEGVFGRVGSLGALNNVFEPMDLFRFAQNGVRDYTGGRDGVTTVFGLDSTHLTNLVFHNSLASGAYDGQDLADWQNTSSDAFGPAVTGVPGTVSATDLRILDILGWTPSAAATGQQITATAASPTVQGGSGDDTINGGPVADYLRGGQGDDVIFGGPAFDDINGNQGNDTIHGLGGGDWLVGGQGADSIFGGGAGDILLGNLGNDTLVGASGGEVIRGGQGDDVLTGGAGNDYISGDRGNDTETGGPGADIFHSFSGAGVDRVLDFNVAEGDKVMLDPGTQFSVNQVGADTVIDMGNGDQVILVGVQAASLPPGTIFLG